MASTALPPGRVVAEKRDTEMGCVPSREGAVALQAVHFGHRAIRQVSREEKGHRLDGALGLPLLPLSSLYLSISPIFFATFSAAFHCS